MPDIITHYIFGQNVLEKINSDERFNLKSNSEIFNIGCQGPDPFLYNVFSSVNGQKIGSQLGNVLHDKKCGDFIIDFLNIIKRKDKDSNDYKELLSYLIGYVCHYSLDKTAHPYIYHVTGIYDKNKKETHPYRGNHKRLELAIDTILLNKMFNMDSKKFSITKNILNLKFIPSSISNTYDKIISKLYNISNSGKVFENSYKDMRKIIDIAYDPFGIKKIIARILDHTINRNGNTVYTTLSYYNSVNKKIDYLNLTKAKWYHPCDDKETHDYNFYEMMNIASEKALNYIDIILDYLHNSKHEENLSNIFRNESYNTGKISSEDLKMKHFNVIF